MNGLMQEVQNCIAKAQFSLGAWKLVPGWFYSFCYIFYKVVYTILPSIVY